MFHKKIYQINRFEVIFCQIIKAFRNSIIKSIEKIDFIEYECIAIPDGRSGEHLSVGANGDHYY